MTDHKNLPPGQMKKVYGTKYVKSFLPGQQKNDRYYYDEHGKMKKKKKAQKESPIKTEIKLLIMRARIFGFFL